MPKWYYIINNIYANSFLVERKENIDIFVFFNQIVPHCKYQNIFLQTSASPSHSLRSLDLMMSSAITSKLGVNGR